MKRLWRCGIGAHPALLVAPRGPILGPWLQPWPRWPRTAWGLLEERICSPGKIKAIAGTWLVPPLWGWSQKAGVRLEHDSSRGSLRVSSTKKIPIQARRLPSFHSDFQGPQKGGRGVPCVGR